MAIQRFVRLLGCAALAMTPTSFLAAQEASAIGAGEQAQIDRPDPEIVVNGYTEKEVRTFLWRAIESDGRLISRRSTPICIGIDNAPAALADPVRARIEANLAALNIATAGPGCKANATIVFYRDAHAFVNWLGRRDNGAAFWSLYRPQKRRLISPVRSAYAWHYLPAKAAQLRGGLVDAVGAQPGQIAVQPIGFEMGGRIAEGLTPVESSHSFAVIDTDALDGLTVEQVGDWLTMHMLVDFNPDPGDTVPADSILNLFTRSGSNPAAAAGLSRLDRAVLTQIYAQAQNFRAGAIRAGAARTAVQELKQDGYLLADTE